mgnify:FL=1
MFRQSISYFKFFVKVRIIYVVRKFLVSLLGVSVNDQGRGKRILFVNLEGLGDLVVMTGVLKHYAAALPESEIYLLVNQSTGLTREVLPSGIKEVLTTNYRSLVRNPWYGFQLANRLRRIGFETVVSHDPSTAEIIGKMIVLEIGASRTIGYEGLGIQFQKPFDINMVHNVAFVQKSLFPRYSEVIPSIDRTADLSNRLPHFLRHYIAIFEYLTKHQVFDSAPVLYPVATAEEKVKKTLFDAEIEPGSYCLLSLGTTTIHREWPPERFAAVARILQEKNIPIVIAGSKHQAGLARAFRQVYRGRVLDLTGETSVIDLISLIHLSLFSWSNDTGNTHIAVALKKPSLSILGIGHFGMLSLYGYPRLNWWVYVKGSCLCDNWHCIYTVSSSEPTVCIQAVQEEDVKRALNDLLQNVHDQPKEFEMEFATEI